MINNTDKGFLLFYKKKYVFQSHKKKLNSYNTLQLFLLFAKFQENFIY